MVFLFLSVLVSVILCAQVKRFHKSYARKMKDLPQVGPNLPQSSILEETGCGALLPHWPRWSQSLLILSGLTRITTDWLFWEAPYVLDMIMFPMLILDTVNYYL